MSLSWATIWIEYSASKYAILGNINVNIRSATTIFYILKAEFCSGSAFFWEFVFMLAGSESESATPEINHPSESGRKAQKWFFQAFVRLKDGQTFSNLLDSRKQQLETSLDEFGWQYVRTRCTILYISQFPSCIHPQLHRQPVRQPYMGEQLPGPSPFFQMQPRWTREFEIHLKPSLPLYKSVYNRLQ